MEVGVDVARDAADGGATPRWYFSPEQRDSVEDGCPNAALLDTKPSSSRARRSSRTAWTGRVRSAPATPCSRPSDCAGRNERLYCTIRAGTTDRRYELPVRRLSSNSSLVGP